MYIIANNILEHNPARVKTTYYTGQTFTTNKRAALLIHDEQLKNLLLHKFNCTHAGWCHAIKDPIFNN